jgi:hypothetical protein
MGGIMEKTDESSGQNGRVVSRSTFAWNCGCTEKTLRNWVASGMLGALPDGRIEVRAAHKWVIDRQVERLAAKAVKSAGGQSAEELKRRILAVDLSRKKIAEARESAEAARLAGDLVSGSEMSAGWADFIVEMRNDLLAVPSRLGSFLAGRHDTLKIVAMVDGLIRASLTRIGGWGERPVDEAAVADAAQRHPDEIASKPAWEDRIYWFGSILHHTIGDAIKKLRKIEQAQLYIMLRAADGSPIKGDDGAARVIFVADGEIASINSKRVDQCRPEPGAVEDMLSAWVAHAALFAGLPVPHWAGRRAEVIDFTSREGMRSISYGRLGFVAESEIDAFVAAWLN